ncbi:MAG TPA: PKD domain-containing protein [Bacteroidales bacterium]|nr:PKD domain-containing protein [Bacteroidales bacterium]HSA42359.1 PKD domain-containing protein [Bacteroidales bacterium]
MEQHLRFFVVTSTLIVAILLQDSVFGQPSPCTNSDFSIGLAGWNGSYGTFDDPYQNSGFITADPARHHIITSPGGFDPHSGGLLPMLPPGANFSLRLGNDNANSEAETISYSTVVSSLSTLFVYRYAIVLEAPDDHGPSQQPSLTIRVFDQAGNLINSTCGYYQVTASLDLVESDPTWHLFPDGSGVYKDWTTVGMDLSGLIGQTVTIEFTTRDCSLGGHFGYAYLSTFCSMLNMTVGYCPGNNSATLTAPEGFSYLWSTGETTQSIVVSNPQPGTTGLCTLTSVNGCSVDISAVIQPTIITPNFAFDSNCIGQDFHFYDQSSINQNDIVDYAWEFGDGSTPVTGSPIPTHIFTSPGTYPVTLTVTSNDGCSASAMHYITVETLPLNFTVTGGGNFPNGGPGVPIGLSNSQTGVVYTLMRSGSPDITILTIPGTGGPINFGTFNVEGDYFVKASYAGLPACEVSSGNSVNVHRLPYPLRYLVSGGGNFCEGGPDIFIHMNGSEQGVFYELQRNNSNLLPTVVRFGTGAPLDFGPVTQSGVYSVHAVHITSGLDTLMTGQANITINPRPTKFLVSSFGDLCPGTEVLLNGSELGVHYNLMVGNDTITSFIGTGNILNFGSQFEPGIYKVIAINAATGCIEVMNGNVGIYPLPSFFDIQYQGVNCAGNSIGLDGSEIGVKYELFLNGIITNITPIYGTGNSISFGNVWMPGNYTILATNPLTNCSRFMSGTSMFYNMPVSYQMTPTGTVCAGTAIGCISSQVDVIYILKRDSIWIDTIVGNGGAISFPPQYAQGNYTITGYTSASSFLCSQEMSGSVIITPNPINYPWSPNSSACIDNSQIILAGSQPNTTYRLYCNGLLVASLPGSGGTINFGQQINAGNYKILAVNNITNCESWMNGSLQLLPELQKFLVLGNGSCSGMSVGLSGSQINVHYQLYLDSAAIGTQVLGNGSVISFGPQYAAGTYTVVATGPAPEFCQQVMLGSQIVQQPPNQYSIQPNGYACPGDEIRLSGSEVGVNYQLMQGNNLVGSPVAGTGYDISFGVQTTTGTFHIIAFDGNNCPTDMIGTVQILASPQIYSIYSNPNNCSGATIYLNGSQTGRIYNLIRDNIHLAATMPGTGSALSFGQQITAGMYTVEAINNSLDSCSATMMGAVTIISKPSIYTWAPNGVYCIMAAPIILALSEIGVEYQLRCNNLLVMTQQGTGGPLNFGIQTLTGSYIVKAVRIGTLCESQMAGSLFLQPWPAIFNMTTNGSSCGSFTPGLNGSQTTMVYTLLRDGLQCDLPVNGTNGPINFGIQSIPGTYTIIASYPSSPGCPVNMNGSFTLQTSPEIYVVGPSGLICEPSGIMLYPATQLGVDYELYRYGISTGLIITGTGSIINFPPQPAGEYTVVARYNNTGQLCSSLMSGMVVIDAIPVINMSPTAQTCSNTNSYIPSINYAGAGTYLWTTSGDGTFSPSANVPHPTYLIGPSDQSAGQFTLTISITGQGGCSVNAFQQTQTVTISPAPTCYAGSDTTICSGSVLSLSGSASNFGLLQWSSSGDGIFSDSLSLNPSYTPGTIDLINSPVSLTLLAQGVDGCINVVDSSEIQLSIHKLPSVILSHDTTVCTSYPVTMTIHFTGTAPWSATIVDGIDTIYLTNITQNPYSFSLIPDSTITYTAIECSDSVCYSVTNSNSVNITVVPAPELFTLIAENNGVFCMGGSGVEIRLDGSQVGFSYALFLNDTIQVTSLIQGNGSPIIFGTFAQTGIYTAIAYSNLATCSLQMNTITLSHPPTPPISILSEGSCYGDTTIFHFSGSNPAITSYHVAFGEGTMAIYSSLPVPSIVYPTTGIFLFTLSVLDSNSCTFVYQDSVSIHSNPIANFTVTSTLCQNRIFSFEDSSSTIPGDNSYLTTWTWNFGNGSTQTINFPDEPSGITTFSSAGVFNVTLSVSNNFGCTNSTTIPVTVKPAPIANFTYTSGPICQNQTVTFTSNTQTNGGGLIEIETWKFGSVGNFTGSGSIYDTTFSMDGTLPVIMVAMNTDGCTDTIIKQIIIHPLPVSEFSLDPIVYGSFSPANISAGASNYIWYAPGSNLPFCTLTQPQYHYPDDGHFGITLIAVSSFGCSDTSSLHFKYIRDADSGLFIPTAFAPDSPNDLVNRFKCVGIHLLRYKIVVYDQWGHEVWASEKLDSEGSPAESWDGTHHGDRLPQGNYMWRASALYRHGGIWAGNNVDGHITTSGSVLLIR